MSGVRPVSPVGAFTSACPLFTRKRTALIEPVIACMSATPESTYFLVAPLAAHHFLERPEHSWWASMMICDSVSHRKVDQPEEAVLIGLWCQSQET